MKRDPNDWIPGFEGEFVGTVGNEKRIHKTHFTMNRTLRKTKKSRIVWVKVGPGRYKGVFQKR